MNAVARQDEETKQAVERVNQLLGELDRRQLDPLTILEQAVSDYDRAHDATSVSLLRRQQKRACESIAVHEMFFGEDARPPD